jgi:hypothetical protein
VIELIDDEFVPNERKDKNEIEIKFWEKCLIMRILI